MLLECLVGAWMGSTCKDWFLFKLLSCSVLYDDVVVQVPFKFCYFSYLLLEWLGLMFF